MKTAALRSLRAVLVVALLTPWLSNAQSSVMVADLSNKKVHVAANANQKRGVGGLAKIATTMVTLDWAEAAKAALTTQAVVPEYAERIAGDGASDLRAGDQVSLRDLLYSTMMGSDNVAAITLGHFVGSDLLARKGKQGDPLEEFAKQMNSLAAREGCKNTRFVTPHGFENSRPQPHSTAADIARLAIYATSRASFHFYTNQRSRKISINRGGQSMNVTVTNTNNLLGTARIDGMKATITPVAGGCVAITADRPNTAIKQENGSIIFRHRLVVIVLGSGDPFGEARQLLSQGWVAYDAWLTAGRPVTDRAQLLQYF
jgi:serine-type D-Ala-D-Ala carboxypeptidase (penicillin-binding protein 5/6)